MTEKMEFTLYLATVYALTMFTLRENWNVSHASRKRNSSTQHFMDNLTESWAQMRNLWTDFIRFITLIFHYIFEIIFPLDVELRWTTMFVIASIDSSLMWYYLRFFVYCRSRWEVEKWTFLESNFEVFPQIIWILYTYTKILLRCLNGFTLFKSWCALSKLKIHVYKHEKYQ